MMPRCDSPEGSNKVPRSFYCPLTLEVMVDPVIDAEGNTFERQALMRWLSHYGASPVSRQPLNANLVVPNFALRDIIHEVMGSSWVDQRTEELGHQYSFSSLAELQDDDFLQPDSLDNSSSSHVSYNSSPASKYRGKMQCYLKKLSQDVGGGMQLQLDDSGICMFNCENMTIVVEVPEDAGSFYVYTVVTVPTLSEESKDMMLELNRLQSETREYILAETRLANVSSSGLYLTFFRLPLFNHAGGGTLSIKKHESGQYDIFFTYSDRINEIAAADFCNIVPNFIETAARLKGRFLGSDHQDNPAPSSMDSTSSLPQQETNRLGSVDLPRKYL